MSPAKTLALACAIVVCTSPAVSRAGLLDRRGGAAVQGTARGSPEDQPVRSTLPGSGILEVGPEPGSGRSPFATASREPSATTTQPPRASAASLPHDVLISVPTGVCKQTLVCVHCRGCVPGRCIKVCGCLPACVTCQPRTFRVVNPANGCPVDVTACLPDAPEKARRIERDPYYITYHYENCRITLWFLFERNNDYIVRYASEKP